MDIKKIYKMEGLYMLMKKGVLIFGLVFVSLMIVLTFARVSMSNNQTGINGNVVKDELNPVFSWRDFNVEAKGVEFEGDSAVLKYGLREFTGESQKITVNFNLESEKGARTYGEEVVLPSGAYVEYTKIFQGLDSGKYNLEIEASNGRKVADDGIGFAFSKPIITGNAIEEIKVNGWNNYILLFLILALLIIILIQLRRKKTVVESYKSRHKNRFISLDLR